MKHLAALFLLFIFLTVESSAQLNYGPSFGMVATTIRGDSDFSPTIRYFGGGAVSLNIFRYRAALQADVLVIGTGAVREDQGAITSYQLRTTHLALPLQIKFRIRQRWHTGFGYQYSAMLLANETYRVNGNSRDIDASANFAAGDAGPFVDLGFQALFGAGFHIRYYYGSRRINTTGDVELNNSYLQAGVFYMFGRKPERFGFRRPRLNDVPQ